MKPHRALNIKIFSSPCDLKLQHLSLFLPSLFFVTTLKQVSQDKGHEMIYCNTAVESLSKCSTDTQYKARNTRIQYDTDLS